MKKKLLLFIFIFGFSIPMFSQVLFDFDININTKIKDGKVVGDVRIELTKGETPVKYIIIDGTRINDKVLVESKFTKKTVFKFKDIPAGKYLLKIEDEEGRIAGKAIEISQ